MGRREYLALMVANESTVAIAVISVGMAVILLRVLRTAVNRRAETARPPLDERLARSLWPKLPVKHELLIGTMVTRQGLRIATYSIRAERPVGAVVLVHGFRVSFRFEFLRPSTPGKPHTVWDGSVLAQLLSKGLSVYGIDQRGHGQSDGLRAYVDHFDDLPTDLLQFLREFVVPELTTEQLPLFLYGQSLGGAVVLRAAQLADGVVDGHPITGIVCGAPLVSAGSSLSAALRLAVGIMGTLLPTYSSTFASGPNGIDNELYAQEIASEPTHFHGNPRWGFIRQVLMICSRFMRANGRGALETVRVRSLLTVHSRADGLTEYRGSEALYARASATRKTLVLLRGIDRDGKGRPGEAMATVDGLAVPVNAGPWHRGVLDLPLWHNLTREPGGEVLADAIAQWVRGEAIAARIERG